MTHPAMHFQPADHDVLAGPHRSTTVEALGRAAGVLREVAVFDGRTDLRRAEVTAAHAALLEACATHLSVLPAEVAARAQSVVAALDHATGRRGHS